MKAEAGTSGDAKKKIAEEYPLYCDYSCRYSAFGDPCAVGACRRDVGIWCGKAGRLHSKHAPCLFRPTVK